MFLCLQAIAQLLYQAARDGQQQADFMRKAGGRSHTLILIQVREAAARDQLQLQSANDSKCIAAHDSLMLSVCALLQVAGNGFLFGAYLAPAWPTSAQLAAAPAVGLTVGDPSCSSFLFSLMTGGSAAAPPAAESRPCSASCFQRHQSRRSEDGGRQCRVLRQPCALQRRQGGQLAECELCEWSECKHCVSAERRSQGVRQHILCGSASLCCRGDRGIPDASALQFGGCSCRRNSECRCKMSVTCRPSHSFLRDRPCSMLNFNC